MDTMFYVFILTDWFFKRLFKTKFLYDLLFYNFFLYFAKLTGYFIIVVWLNNKKAFQPKRELTFS